MALKLMYITNEVDIAKIAQEAGVDRIFVDMEYIGKDKRQKGLNTVQNHHTVDDVKKLRKEIKKAELLVRVNPIHEAAADYTNSEEEIEAVIDAGADIVMLPYFSGSEEVKRFIKDVNKRAKTMLLLESQKSVDDLDEILKIEGIDEILIGLNDLSLDNHKKFMFELLADGTVEKICNKIKPTGIPYGFGGIASLGRGMLPAEYIIKEHYRLGSTSTILSRSFCNASIIEDRQIIRMVFNSGVDSIRKYEERCQDHKLEDEFYTKNPAKVKELVKKIVEQ